MATAVLGAAHRHAVEGEDAREAFGGTFGEPWADRACVLGSARWSADAEGLRDRRAGEMLCAARLAAHDEPVQSLLERRDGHLRARDRVARIERNGKRGGVGAAV